MASRTISLTEDVYERLKRHKKPHESFSDTVRRLTRGRSLLELSTVFSTESARRLADAYERNRAAWIEMQRKELRK